jgi:hypothetical protein
MQPGEGLGDHVQEASAQREVEVAIVLVPDERYRCRYFVDVALEGEPCRGTCGRCRADDEEPEGHRLHR